MNTNGNYSFYASLMSSLRGWRLASLTINGGNKNVVASKVVRVSGGGGEGTIGLLLLTHSFPHYPDLDDLGSKGQT